MIYASALGADSVSLGYFWLASVHKPKAEKFSVSLYLIVAIQLSKQAWKRHRGLRGAKEEVGSCTRKKRRRKRKGMEEDEDD